MSSRAYAGGGLSGKITELAVKYDDVSLSRLSDTLAASSSDLIGTWRANTGQGGVVPGVPDVWYMQIFDDGTIRWAVSPDDLSVPPDSSHVGALLSWAYDDFLLSLQNQGPATEHYCEADDVGTYLVKRDEEGGIVFRVVGDPCVFRRINLLFYGTAWGPHAP